MLEHHITPEQQHALQEVINICFDGLEGQGKLRAAAWSRFKNKFKVAKYDQTKASDFEQALSYLWRICVEKVKEKPGKTVWRKYEYPLNIR